MLEKLMTLIVTLIASLDANTAAHGGGESTTAAGSAAPTAAQKAAAKKKAAAAAKAKAKGKGKGKVTLAAAKAKAGEVAKASGDFKGCLDQIRSLVAEVAVKHYADGSKTIEDFNETALTLFVEALDSFDYQAPGAEPEEEEADKFEL